jgi:hypothetical protein
LLFGTVCPEIKQDARLLIKKKVSEQCAVFSGLISQKRVKENGSRIKKSIVLQNVDIPAYLPGIGARVQSAGAPFKAG